MGALFAFVTVLVVRGGAQESRFPNDPKYSWVVAGLRIAEQEGFLVFWSSHRYLPGRTASRYEYAVATHATATNHLFRLESFLTHPQDGRERAALLRGANLLSFYRRSEREFKRELTSLGVADDFGQARLAELTRQIEATSEPKHRLFPDVPPGHWAAKVVGDLRAVGLLDGYPDGTYRG